MKKAAAIIICALATLPAVLWCIVGTVFVASDAPGHAVAANAALAHELRQSVEELCAAPRYGETLQQAEDYITRTLADAGYGVRFQEFRNGATAYRNIIAERKGTAPGRYIIGAHYDACEPDDEADSNPGADDNASAVATLLALARRMPQNPRYTVEMVFYACEEPPWFDTEGMGSHHHAQSCDAQEVLGMICLEMLGYFSEEEGSQPSLFPGQSLLVPGKGDFIAVVGDMVSLSLARCAAGKLAKRMRTLRANVPFAHNTELYFSDHRNYVARGIPSIMVTDTSMLRNKRYHEATDTPDSLDYDNMARITAGMLETVKQLAWEKQ
ncbi:MAG: M28 family peptidase [Akkermansia sp.]|nr:M28 family peptidase [Akkermansia sp.]